MKNPTIAIATLLLFQTYPVHSATVLTSPSEFQLPTSLITFETFPGGAVVPYNSRTLADQWISLGTRISDDSTGDGASAYSKTFSVPPHSGTRAISDSTNAPGGFLEFTFVIPNSTVPAFVTEVGLWTQNGDESSTVTFYDPTGSVIQSLTPALGDNFAGLRATQGIARVRVSDTGFYLVDDLQFSQPVPEPSATLTLLIGFGLLGLALRVRTTVA